MNRNLQYAFLTFLTLGLLGSVSFVAGMLFAGLSAQGCYLVQHSPENTAFQVAWIASLCLGSLIPSILIWKQRLSGALISTLPFGLCSCCICLFYAGSVCK